CQQHNCYPYSF
nr:immunoglobulin light chain junction region [Macaca mulatta]